MFWGRVDILASIMLYLTGSKFFTIEKGLFVGRWLNAVSNEYVPNGPHGSRGFHIFFKRTYHDSSASLAKCLAGLMMFLRPHVTTNRPYFIINPVGTRQGLV